MKNTVKERIEELMIKNKISKQTDLLRRVCRYISPEIDDEDWNSVKPTPSDMVIITGETDKNGNIMEIDVDTISLKSN